MENLLAKVHAANIHDTNSGCHVYQKIKQKFETICGVCADAGYCGTFVKFVKEKHGENIDISRQIKPKEWKILPKRRRIERTFAWLNYSRRLSKDYEITFLSSVNFIYISLLHVFIKC